jgi:hypothetical protein
VTILFLGIKFYTLDAQELKNIYQLLVRRFMSEEIKEQSHSLSEEELAILDQKYQELKHKVTTESYEMTLDDQKLVVDWVRANRETKFILNAKTVKEKKEKVVKVKKPKKLTQKALGLLLMRELAGEVLTDDEKRNKEFTLTGEILDVSANTIPVSPI